jgi:glutathione S-transferase
LEYKTCAEARSLPGLRLVLSVGSPNPWGEAAKAVFHVRRAPFIAVGRVGLDDDPEIYAWTGQRNVPVAMYADEKPRSSWIDILYLAERLGEGPSLLPQDPDRLVECIGISHRICGEDGLGWNRRLDQFRTMVEEVGGDAESLGLPARLYSDYRITPEAMAQGTDRLIAILRHLDARIERQRAHGSEYLVGNSLSASDLHLATMFGMLDPLPHEFNPMPLPLRGRYESGRPELRAAVTDTLRRHRDMIYDRHLKLPMDF